MDAKEIILSEGWFYKESKMLKRLIRVWLVLTAKQLITYKSSDKAKPTLRIPVQEIKLPENISSGAQKGLSCL